MGSMITKLMCGSFSNMCALCCSACTTLQSQGLEPSQAPLSTEFSRQEYWRWLPSPIPGDLLHPGMEPTSLESLILAGGFFITAPPGKPHFAIYKTSNHVYTLNLIQCYMSITLNKTCAGSSLEHLSALFDSINIHYLLKESERGRAAPAEPRSPGGGERGRGFTGRTRAIRTRLAQGFEEKG